MTRQREAVYTVQVVSERKLTIPHGSYFVPWVQHQTARTDVDAWQRE